MRFFQLSLFLALAYALATYPSWWELNTGFLGGARGDAALYAWLMRSNAENFFSFQSTGFDAGIYYPFSKSLAFTDNFLLPGLIAKVLLGVGLTQELTFNLILIAASIFSGIGAYLLCSRLEESASAKYFAAMALMLCPYTFSHLGHTQLQFVGFIPLSLYLTIRYWETRHKIFAAASGLNLLAVLCCSVYFFIFCLLIIAISSLFYLVLKFKKISARELSVAVGVNIPAIVLILAVLYPYYAVVQEFGKRRYWEVSSLSSSVGAYISAPISNSFWGTLTHSLSHFDAQFFMGVCVSLFALGGVISMLSTKPNTASDQRQLSKRELVVLLLLLLVTFTLLSFGTPPKITEDESPLSLFYYAWKYLPGFGAIRATGRFGIVVCALLAVLAGVGIGALMKCEILKTHSRLRCSLLGVIFIVAFFELRSSPPAIVTAPAKAGVWQALEREKSSGAVIALPFGYVPKLGSEFAYRQSDVMLWSQDSNRKIMNGHSGVMPHYFHYLDKELRNFPDERSLRTLSSTLGLRYIVYLPQWQQSFDKLAFEQQLSAYKEQLRLVHQDTAGNYLLEFTPQRKLDRLRLFIANSEVAEMRHELHFEVQFDTHFQVNSAAQTTDSEATLTSSVNVYSEKTRGSRVIKRKLLGSCPVNSPAHLAQTQSTPIQITPCKVSLPKDHTGINPLTLAFEQKPSPTKHPTLTRPLLLKVTNSPNR